MSMRPLLLLPEILLFLGGLVVLFSGSFLAQGRQWVTRVMAAAALLAATVAAAKDLAGTAEVAMEGTFTIDVTTGVARIVATLGVLVVLALATDEIAGTARESETYALMLFSTTGTLVLAGADDLLVVVVGFLLASIPLYGLIGIARTPAGAEAAMKTYLLGALFGILMLLGVTVLYGVTATTSYAVLGYRLVDAPAGAVAAGVVAILAALMFKAGGVPGHFWIPDAAQGAGGAVAAFLTTIPKAWCHHRGVPTRCDAARHLGVASPDRDAGGGQHDPRQPGRLLADRPPPPARLVHRQPGRLPPGARGGRRPQ
ncbi:proton-conducting transporter membrane subunit [Nocardioides convexus]|uniref:proton-conducting transporter transmembrane domain-containing protein n=1 Tax=Nocardioides convexus TaxID=2712224 RepID=UPI002418630E|nr:proton-conducting transporter membrane subunit [Nocardioides convexus]